LAPKGASVINRNPLIIAHFVKSADHLRRYYKTLSNQGSNYGVATGFTVCPLPIRYRSTHGEIKVFHALHDAHMG